MRRVLRRFRIPILCGTFASRQQARAQMDVEFASRMRETESSEARWRRRPSPVCPPGAQASLASTSGIHRKRQRGVGRTEEKEIAGLSEAEAIVRRLASTDISRAAEIL